MATDPQKESKYDEQGAPENELPEGRPGRR